MALNTTKNLTIDFGGLIYKKLIKPILFKIDPEIVHEKFTAIGELLGNINIIKNLTRFLFQQNFKELEQNVADIKFERPLGLAAGFDYEARLTQMLPAIGFGFETVGTITYSSYEGNPRPMLGRLPKSKSLMVNKGFKNLGIIETIKKLNGLNFETPIGISIGRTNSLNLKTQQESVEDIIKSFKVAEASAVKHSYYELNISCPNLYGDITFYPPENLDELLTEIDKLNLKRPVFIKMPIEKSDSEVTAMLEVISKHSPKGVIFGNLQKDRNNPALDQSEVKKFEVGNFSGKPTYERSNQLIKLAYNNYHDRFIIIGCGGVFSAEDAYKKIKLGASIVQLITGMIYEGPQLISQINSDLVELLHKDGFTHISQAVGIDNKS